MSTIDLSPSIATPRSGGRKRGRAFSLIAILGRLVSGEDRRRSHDRRDHMPSDMGLMYDQIEHLFSGAMRRM